MKLVLLFLGSFLVGACATPHGPFEAFYENGQVNERGVYQHGKRDGVWEWYYENGQLEKRGSLDREKEEGPWEYFYEDGTLSERVQCKIGRQ